jgi:hypothetical protein
MKTPRQNRLPPPRPVPSTPWVLLLDRAVSVVLATGMVLTVAGAVLTPTMGGRRSARLKWQGRAREAEAAIEKARRGNER